MKPIELVFLILSAAAGVIVLFMMITLIRKAERDKASHDADQAAQTPDDKRAGE